MTTNLIHCLSLRSQVKRILRRLFAFVVSVLAIASLAWANISLFKADTASMGPTKGSLTHIAFGEDDVTDEETLTRVGGVLFQGRISTDSVDLRNAQLSGPIEFSDGMARISLRSDKGEFSYLVHEWVFHPTVRFASQRYTAAATFFGEPEPAELSLVYGERFISDQKLVDDANAAVATFNARASEFNNCIKSIENGQIFSLSSLDCKKMLIRQNISSGRPFERDEIRDLLRLGGRLENFNGFGLGAVDLKKLESVVPQEQRALQRMNVEIDRLNSRARDASVRMEAERKRSHETGFFSKYYLADLHPALSETRLGFRLLQADSLLATSAVLNSLSLNQGEVLFDGEQSSLGDDGSPTDIQTFAAVRIQSTLANCKREHPDINMRAWILTDFDTEYKTSISSDGSLSISGTPFFYVWGRPKDETDKRIRELSACTNALRDISDTNYEVLAPNVWMAVLESARFSAFFRYVSQRNPSLARSIRVASDDLSGEFFTPRKWPKDGRL